MERLYLVTSGEYDYTEWVDEYGGPTYSVSDFAEVTAPNARAAKVLALQSKDFEKWVDLCRSDSKNPFVGVTAIRADECYINECYGCDKCDPDGTHRAAMEES